MENEDSSQEINLLLDSYEILYPEQKYEKSSEYKKWERAMLKKFGENRIKIVCNKDNIVTYQKFDNIDQILKCPKCKANYYYCSYCKRAEKERRCCSKAYIKKLLNDDLLFKFLKLEDNNIKRNFIENIVFHRIPFFANLSINICIFLVLYMDIIKNDVNCDDWISNDKLNLFNKLIIAGFMIIMSLIYMILYYICFIILIILSLPFKLYPIKILIGFIDLIN